MTSRSTTTGTLLLSDEYVHFCKQFDVFKLKMRQGDLGKTAQFWLQYCDSVWVLKRFHQAFKENNFGLFVSCLREMCALMFSADRLHYARYLPL